MCASVSQPCQNSGTAARAFSWESAGAAVIRTRGASPVLGVRLFCRSSPRRACSRACAGAHRTPVATRVCLYEYVYICVYAPICDDMDACVQTGADRCARRHWVSEVTAATPGPLPGAPRRDARGAQVLLWRYRLEHGADPSAARARVRPLTPPPWPRHSLPPAPRHTPCWPPPPVAATGPPSPLSTRRTRCGGSWGPPTW